MSRYDFIRFGGFVNWADEDTDTFRKMKVCLPVKEPVEDDTKIGLISTDEDNPEEIAVSYSVRAAELIPWTDSFQEGYWKALIVAEANGAGTDVLLPMLKDAGLCLMECVFLMLRSIRKTHSIRHSPASLSMGSNTSVPAPFASATIRAFQYPSWNESVQGMSSAALTE